MAPIDMKRKTGPTNESFVRNKKAKTTDAPPSKRPRKDQDNGEKKSTQKPIAASRLSKIGDEEAAFPRGGASVLTPLEHKQIQIDATRDVLFEQEESKLSKRADELEDAPVRKGSKSKNKGKTTIKPNEPEPDVVKIEGLSYKVCTF